ncbi:MAG: hypothetical protein V4581_06240 [Bacteroidota bacterium]
MKKLFILTCFWGLAAAAQSISPKDVLGNWKVVTITTPELSVDMKTMQVTLTPETIAWAKKKNKSTDALKTDALKNAGEYVNTTYSFTAKGIYTEKKGSNKPVKAEYELTNSDGQNVIILYYPDQDTEDMYYVNFIAQQLYLEYDEAEVTLVCEKTE